MPAGGDALREEDSRRAGREGPGPGRPDADELARRIESEIAALARRLHLEMFGAGAAPPGSLRLSLDLVVDPALPARPGPSEPLGDQVRQALRRAAASAEPFHSGRVFCYRCEASSCEHSAPPRPQSVFSGYGPTGVPQWSDLAQLLLDLRDDRVEDLFRDPPGNVARLFFGRELKGRQLHPFGRASKSYDLLGQLVAGYFGGRREALFAVTLQAVESRYPDSRTRISLNLIGTTPAGASAETHFAEGAAPWFQDLLRTARARARALEDDLARTSATGKRRSEILRRVPGLLAEIGRGVERAGRQHERRTRHAEERREDRRPTQAALRDARRAGDASIFADEQRGTLIVVGPRGRVHAFAPGGRHVTTMVLEGDALDRRLRTERWRPATREEIRCLRERLPPD